MSAVSKYQFLATAIAGRRVVLQLSEDADQRACSDGQSITLPVSHAQNDTLCWLEIAAQASLIAAGSLEPQIMRHLIGKRNAQWRYLYLEAVRSRSLLADRLPVRFIDHVEWGAGEVMSDSAQDSLRLALQKRALPVPPAFFGTLRPLGILTRAFGNEGFATLGKHQQKNGLQDAPIGLEEIPEYAAAQESKLLKFFSNPLFSGGPIADLLTRILGGGIRKSPDQQTQQGSGSGEMPVGRVEHTARRSPLSTLTELPFSTSHIAMNAAPSENVYPEWDIDRKGYRPRWVFAGAVVPTRDGGPRNINHLFSNSLSRQLRRQLASLGLSHELHGRQSDGTDLDLSPLIESAIDLRAGHGSDAPRVYRANRCTRRDLGVAIVLDVSGSTGEGSGAEGTQFDKQLQVAQQLGRAFDALGDTVEIFGFQSWGRNAVRWLLIKAHDERWTASVTERFAHLEPAGYTRLGAAIRHGERRLRTGIRLPFRLMLLVTDGLPYDQDYEGAYAEADARKALEEVRAAGTACICLCIGSLTDAHKLEAVFGSTNLIAVDEPAQITRQIRVHCRTALAGVARRKINRTHAA